MPFDVGRCTQIHIAKEITGYLVLLRLRNYMYQKLTAYRYKYLSIEQSNYIYVDRSTLKEDFIRRYSKRLSEMSKFNPKRL